MTKKKKWTTITEFGEAMMAAYQLGREDMAWTLTNHDPVKKIRQVTQLFLRLSYLEHASRLETKALLVAYRAGEQSAQDRMNYDPNIFAAGMNRDE